MAKLKPNKGRYNFLIDRSVYDDFSMLCEELGLVRGKKLERYMQEFVDKNKELLKKVLIYNEDDCIATRIVKDWIVAH